MSDGDTMGVPRSEVEKVKSQHWRYKETDYVLGYIPSGCDKCGDEIPEDHAGYIVSGPESPGESDLGELCFDCGDEVTDFAG